MSKTHTAFITERHLLFWFTLFALALGWVMFLISYGESRDAVAQLTWQGSHLLVEQEVSSAARLVQGHPAASALPASVGVQFIFGIALLLLGFAFHAFLSQSRCERKVPVHARSGGRKQSVYWFFLRV